ncbi:MAG: histidine ammonia-lyase [Bacteroidetes bacterium]|nr:histidine ammonia-lyase [Bacteroidota bacterium]
MNTYQINTQNKLTLTELKNIIENDLKLELSVETEKAIVDCRNFLDEKIKRSKSPVYGINTGFGSLCNVVVPDNDLEKLQENLVKSHACGFGNQVPNDIVKLMLLLKIQSLSYGKSGVQLITVKTLIQFYNLKIYPVVYEQGSLGASGDLAPLAHLCLPLLGLGQVNYNGKNYSSAEILTQQNINAIKLKSKEGLALLNGTQFMSAYGCYLVLKSQHINELADKIAAMSLDAFDGRIDPFKEHLHTIRPHAGQLITSKNIRNYLAGSEIQQQDKKHVQDPYSFRCIPQVHGASKDTLNYVSSVIETEINSVTDNPTVFAEHDEIISGGNFHGQPLALVLDFLCISLSELASISERRTYLLISGQRGLPAFLTPQPGLNSGFMIPQYTAASIVSQSKQLCTPASADSIVSSNGQEDHVSMGANAATKCYTVLNNTEKVLAIELLNAAQALDLKRPLKSSNVIETFFNDFRKKVNFMQHDELVHDLMKASLNFINKA